MSKKLLLTAYLAAAIEHNKSVLEDNKENHKELIKKELYHPLFGIYDPVEREGQKMGVTCGQANTTIRNLKKAGAWESFDDRMKHIWWGQISTDVSNKLPIIQGIRNNFLINGNTINDLNEWADYTAVIRSNFIIAYIEKNVRTVGTYKEIHTAYLLGIPVYLLLPDSTVTEANSTLISMIRDSNGKVFSGKSCTKELIDCLKDRYKIWK